MDNFQKKNEHYYMKKYLTNKTYNLTVLVNVLHVPSDAKPLD